jgi:hypothetical protein
MPKRSKPAQKPTPQDLEREAANREGEAKREKEKKARQANAEKQKRYRERMKAQGYKAVPTWEKPVPPGMVKVSARIHEKSRGIAARDDSAAGKAVHRLYGEIFMMHEKKEISKELYQDILALLNPLGDYGFQRVTK